MRNFKLDSALTVEELIDELKNLPPSAKVLFSYNYRDISNTIVASNVETLDEEFVRWSDYHRMYEVMEEDGKDEEDDPNRIPVVVIR